jgi:hypothetical protein
MLPELRKKIAEYCTGLIYTIYEDEEFGSLILRGTAFAGAEVDLMDEWDPDGDDFKALVRKCAELLLKSAEGKTPLHIVVKFLRFGKALEASDTDALEELLLELLESK